MNTLYQDPQEGGIETPQFSAERRDELVDLLNDAISGVLALGRITGSPATEMDTEEIIRATRWVAERLEHDLRVACAMISLTEGYRQGNFTLAAFG